MAVGIAFATCHVDIQSPSDLGTTFIEYVEVNFKSYLFTVLGQLSFIEQQYSI